MSYSPPYAKVQISVNGATPVVGGTTVSSGDSIQFSGVSTVGWNQQRWELFSYPEGWSVPSGWTLDSDGVIFSSAVRPAAFALPSTGPTAWGKWLIRLRVNGGVSNRSASDRYVDESAGVRVFSPVIGLDETAAGESNQFDAVQSWVGAHKRNLRQIDAAVTTIGANGLNTTDPSAVGEIPEYQGGIWRARRPDGPINVRWFGATGNGTSDDTSAINAAISACPSGGEIYFPAGTYRITSTLTITANDITLLGAKFKSTINAVSCTAVTFSGARSPKVIGLHFAGGGTPGVAAPNGIYALKFVQYCTNAEVCGCWFGNTGDANIYIDNAWPFSVHQNVFAPGALHGLDMNTGVNGATIVDNRFDGVGSEVSSVGIRAVGCISLTLLGNTVETWWRGVQCLSCQGAVISGGYFENCAVGLDLEGGSGYAVKGPRFATGTTTSRYDVYIAPDVTAAKLSQLTFKGAHLNGAPIATVGSGIGFSGSPASGITIEDVSHEDTKLACFVGPDGLPSSAAPSLTLRDSQGAWNARPIIQASSGVLTIPTDFSVGADWGNSGNTHLVGSVNTLTDQSDGSALGHLVVYTQQIRSGKRAIYRLKAKTINRLTWLGVGNNSNVECNVNLTTGALGVRQAGGTCVVGTQDGSGYWPITITTTVELDNAWGALRVGVADSPGSYGSIPAYQGDGTGAVSIKDFTIEQDGRFFRVSVDNNGSLSTTEVFW